MAIFDLDSTLYSTQARNHAILHEFAAGEDGPGLRAAAAGLEAHHMGWNPMSDLRRAGVVDEAALARLRRFWLERFFTSEYLRHDQPLPGASHFVNHVHRAGAVVVYLTGRPAVTMGPGTRQSLVAHGFPLGGERCHLMLKPDGAEPDLVFKARALEAVAELGDVVCAFENEPVNANLFATRFPTAVVILLDTMHMPDAPPLDPRIVRVKDFCLPAKPGSHAP